jgi:hypothetical protein
MRAGFEKATMSYIWDDPDAKSARERCILVAAIDIVMNAGN